jgi:hypothetical protein
MFHKRTKVFSLHLGLSGWIAIHLLRCVVCFRAVFLRCGVTLVGNFRGCPASAPAFKFMNNCHKTQHRRFAAGSLSEWSTARSQHFHLLCCSCTKQLRNRFAIQTWSGGGSTHDCQCSCLRHRSIFVPRGRFGRRCAT